MMPANRRAVLPTLCMGQVRTPCTRAAVLQLLARFTWLFVASLVLGLVIGMASAAIVRWLFPSPSPDREVLVVGLLGE